MELLNNLTKTVDKGKRRVGRGYGSQKGGHTTGRGNKGDKIRGTTKITFDGTKIKKGWIKRTPFLRGKNRTHKLGLTPIFSLSDLDKMFSSGATVDLKALKVTFAKVLGTGKLTKALIFKPGICFSASARQQILSVGGKIEE